jgi:hypothetical protein
MRAATPYGPNPAVDRDAALDGPNEARLFPSPIQYTLHQSIRRRSRVRNDSQVINTLTLPACQEMTFAAAILPAKAEQA